MKKLNLIEDVSLKLSNLHTAVHDILKVCECDSDLAESLKQIRDEISLISWILYQERYKQEHGVIENV